MVNLLKASKLKRAGLGLYPTPYERMPRLEREVGGPRLFVKRDDLTGLAMGGNKARQLNYLLVDAVRKKSDVIITTTGLQSNWARQTTAAAARLGMKAVLVLRTAQYDEAPREFDGNLLLDHIMGADISFIKMRIDEDPHDVLESVAARLTSEGHRPYVLHLSHMESPLAAVSYADAMEELRSQAQGAAGFPDWVVVASGCGTTHAGILLGAKLLNPKTKVIGVSVGAFSKEKIASVIEKAFNGAAKLLGSKLRLDPAEIITLEDYIGEGYGKTSKECLDAIRLAGRTEGLLLDPVYTSKAMAGLIDLGKKGYFKKNDKVCFLHTGGLPALFPYRSSFPPPGESTLIPRS
jgi:D-cysteine desulfhydrase family pyridoxal phosphate-dependent enzyme